MRKLLKRATAISVVAMLLFSFCISVSAVEETNNSQDGLVASITTEKDSFQANEDIDLTFKVTNTNDFAVENVSLEAIIPDGLKLKNENNTSINTVSLASGESLELALTVVKESSAIVVPTETQSLSTENTTAVQTDSVQATTTKANSAVSTASDTNNTNGSDNASIKTGNNTNYILISLICLLSLAVAVFACRFKKKAVKYLSLVLCVGISVGSVAVVGVANTKAEETTVSAETVTLSKEIEVGGTKLTVGAKVDYDKKDETSDENITKLSDDMYITNPQAEHVRYDVDAGIPYVDNEVLVTFKLNVDENAINEFVSSLGGKIIGKIAPTNTYQIEIQVCEEFAEADAIITQIEASELVDFASPDILMLQASDAYYPHSDTEWKDEWSTFPNGDNWGVEAIKSPGAWEYVDYMQDVNVGISDNQFYDHDDLHFESTYFNTVDGSIKSPSHGTHVAGTIGAGFNNGKGVTGVAPKAKLYGWNWNKSKILYNATHTDWFIDTDNIEYNITSSGSQCLMLAQLLAISKCRVINYSAGFDDSGLIYAASRDYSTARRYVNALSDVVEEYLSALIDNPNVPEFIIVTSAGNENNDYFIHDSKGYHKSESFIDDITADKGNILAKYASPYNNIESRKIKDKIIVVGAVENKTKNGVESYSLCEFSNIGNRVDVVAPGKDIESTVNNNGYDKMQGTSMAAPHVTGIAAMLYSLNPDIKADEVKRIICETADRDVDGYKLVNAESAVKEVLGNGTLSGSVASSKTVLPNTKVDAYLKLKSGTQYVDTTYTNDKGIFSMELPGGNYELRFNKEGYKTATITIKNSKNLITILEDSIIMENSPNENPDKNITINEGDIVTFTGVLKLEDYEINSINKGTVCILDLDNPIKCYLNDGYNYDGKTEFNIDSVQINASSFKKYLGQHINVKGEVILARTGHHRRDVVLIDPIIVENSPNENPDGKCGDNLNWLLNNDGTLIISGYGDMYDFNNVTDIPWYNKRSEITSVELIDGLTSVGNSAFWNCSNLTKVDIPNSVISIGYSAFKDCYNLKWVTISDNAKKINDFAFEQCNNLRSVKIGYNIEEIGNSVFYGCNKIERIIIPYGVKKIGNLTFYGCENLWYVRIPSSVTEIGYYAFSHIANSYGLQVYRDTYAYDYAINNELSCSYGDEPETVSICDNNINSEVRNNIVSLIKLKIGESYQLKASAYPQKTCEDGTVSHPSTDFSWNIGNTDIASISTGYLSDTATVEAKSKGETLIYVKTSNGKTSICKIIVE